MATQSSPALRRNQQDARGFHYAAANARRGRRGSAVTFDEITSVFPLDSRDLPDRQHAGTLRSDSEENDDQGSYDTCYTCNTLLERRWVRRLFRLCAVLNLLSLACSAPLRVCEERKNTGLGNCTGEEEESCIGVFTQFVVIAIVDFVVSLLYTLQLIMRIQYTVFYCRKVSI